MSDLHIEKLHPIRLLARPDGELTTVVHSVLLCTIDKTTAAVEVVSKHPQFRKNIEVVEDGIKGLLLEQILEDGELREVDSTCNFVLTNHDGRLYVYASISKNRIIAVVCSLPLFSFCRNLLERIGEESLEVMTPTVYALCELPLFPLPNTAYDFAFSDGKSLLSFDDVELVKDFELHALVLGALTPIMMIRAWEALIVERRILVTSSYSALLLPCCEFIRRLISPLPFMGAYIPQLPASGVEAIEAPGTFIIGVDTNTLRRSSLDLNGIVVLDLDRKIVIFTPSTEDDPYYAAPPVIINNLLHGVNTLLNGPSAKWYNRSIQSSDVRHPYLDGGVSTILSTISRLFIKLNVSMLSAQFCRTKAFYRSLITKDVCSNFFTVLGTVPRTDSSIPIGYSEQYGYKVGCVHLWKASEENVDTIHHTIPCWIEMNDFAMSVYEQADDLPLLFFPIAEFDAVESCALEPDGHVFQLSLKNAQVFRFTAAVPDSRQQWLTAIEEKINLASSSEKKVYSMTTAERQQALDYPAVTPSTSNPGDSNRFNAANIGLPPMPDFVHSSTAQHYHDFRHLVQSTQMVLSLYSFTECAVFDSVFPERSDSLAQYLSKEHSFETKMTRYLGTLHQAIDVVEKIQKSQELGMNDECSNEDLAPLSSTGAPSIVCADGETSRDEIAFSDARMTQSLFSGSTAVPSYKSGGSSDRSSTVDGNGSSRPNFLQRFFSSKKRSEDFSKEDNARSGSEKESEQRNQQVLMDHIQSVRTMYNRCLAELSYAIVDDRIRTLKEFSDGEKNLTVSYPLTQLATLILGQVQAKTGRQVSATTPASSVASTVASPDVKVRQGLAVDIHQRIFEGLSGSHLFSKKRGGVSPLNDESGANGLPRHSSKRYMSAQLALLASTGEFDDAQMESPAMKLPRPSSIHMTTSEGVSPSGDGSLDNKPLSTEDIEASINLSVASDDDDVYVDVEPTDILASDQSSTYTEYLNVVHQEAKLVIMQHLKLLTQASQQNEDEAEPNAAAKRSSNNNTGSSKSNGSSVTSIYQTLYGYCLQNLNLFEEALVEYSASNLIDPTRSTFCLLQVFLAQAEREDFAATFSELAFIHRAYKMGGRVLGLHAYRLILELIHSELKKQIVLKKNVYWNSPGLSVGDFRVYPRTESALRNQEFMTPGKKIHRTKSVVANDFVAEENDFKGEILNEAYICKRLNTDSSPCELSIHLLQRIKEILKSYAQGPTGNSNWKKRTNNGMLKIKVVTESMQEIQRLSAFKKFEAETCQLQRIELNGLTLNERVVLFVNVFNTMTIHACIVRGNPGGNLLERTAFLRSSRYNIGGHIFSLLDIEHGILRSASTKPMVLGPLSVDMSFAANDPRRKYALEEPKPNVSFALFLACPSSPPLCILTDAYQVDREMTKLAQQFFQDTVKFDANEKVINMPALLRVYWADFTDRPNHVLKYVAKVCGPKFHAATKEFLAHIGNASMKTHFQHFDWSPVFTISMR